MNAIPDHQSFAAATRASPWTTGGHGDAAGASAATERRLAAAAAIVAALVLVATLVNGYHVLQTPPDPTFAFRV